MTSAAPSTLGDWLRLKRELAGFTQQELADRAGLTARGIAAIERSRRRRPYPQTIRVLADALGLSDVERAELRSMLADLAPTADRVGASPGHVLGEAVTPLIGRDGALSDLLDLLGERHAKIVTITGPGGVGKTSVALELARRCDEAFPDGVFVVALDTIDDPAHMLAWIASSVGVTGQLKGTETEGLQRYFQDRRVLLILDNFEHLLAAARDVAGLVSMSPSLTILVTSRAPLRLKGEREYPLGPLEVPQLTYVPTPEEVAKSDAVQLFVERGRASMPSFTITQANATAVAAICRRLDGLPLALELAAARLRMLTPTELLARLDRSLPLLTGGARDLPERQRTIRQAIAWSYRILGPEEQALLRRLSILVGGWDTTAAQAIWDDDAATDVLDVLTSLVEHSLVVAEPGDQTTRYRLLETIREFGREQLDASGETELVARLHATWYLRLAEQAAAHYHGPEETEWLDRLEVAHPNLRAAVTYAIHSDDETMVVRLVAALGRFWLKREHFGGGIAWMEAVLHIVRQTAPSPEGATALFYIGRLMWDWGDTAAGISLLRESHAAWTLLGDERGRGSAAVILANMLRLGGETDEAERLLKESIALLDRLGDEPFWLSMGVRILGILALDRGEYSTAEPLLTQALDIARQSAYQWAIAAALHNLAHLLHLRGDHMRSLAMYLENLSISRDQRDVWSITVTLPAIAEVFASLGDTEQAIRLFSAANCLNETLAGRLVAAVPLAERHRRIIDELRTALGQAAFAAAWEAGQSLTADAAVDEATRALEVGPLSSTATKPAEGAPAKLSAREIEVLRLVATGLTNAQVADHLFLSPRTVDAHLRRIYDKLDLSSRAEAVRFTIEHGLG